MKNKRSSIRFLYYIAYCIFGPMLKLVALVTFDVRNGEKFLKFFPDGKIRYKNWRTFMEDLKHQDKRTHDLSLFLPSIMIFLMAFAGLVSLL